MTEYQKALSPLFTNILLRNTLSDEELEAKREIGHSEFLDEYITPENYRPETPHTNRSHKLEDKT